MSHPSVAPWFLVENREPAPFFAGVGGPARPLFAPAQASATTPTAPTKTSAPPPSTEPKSPSLRVVGEEDGEAEEATPSPSVSPAPAPASASASATASVAAPAAPPPAFLAAVARFEALHQEVLQSARAEVLELAIQLARRVVGDAVDRCDLDVTGLLEESVMRLGEGTRATVRVHPSQRSVIERWLAGSSLQSVQVVFDDQIGTADVIVESPSVSIDGRVATRLHRVETAVRAQMERR